MVTIDWAAFGAAIRAFALHEAAHLSAIEKQIGVSHARMVNAAQGKPVGAEIFLTICAWMDADPMKFALRSYLKETGRG